MCRFIETLWVRQGQILHLDYHQSRVDRSRREVLGIEKPLHLNQLLNVPDAWNTTERVKCRLVYSDTIHEITFSEYTPRTIHSLRLVVHDTIQYDYKFADRSPIHRLFAQRNGSDDILIVQQGFITDTSYSNVAFFDGQQWFTPHRPLLPGTARARLLDEGRIKERLITPADLRHFGKCSLINAMLPLGECVLPVGAIRW